MRQTFFTCPPLSHSLVLVQNRKLGCLRNLAQHQPHLSHQKRNWKQRAWTLQTARPVLPHTHFAPGCLSPTMRQPSATYKGDNRLSSATTCSYPSPVTVSAVLRTQMGINLQMTQMTQMAPLKKLRQIHHAYKFESPTAGTGMEMPTSQDVWSTTTKVKQMPNQVRKMPLHQQLKFPMGNRSLQDHSTCITGPLSPASKTTQSTDRTVLITGPSSSTSKMTQSTDRTTCPLTFE